MIAQFIREEAGTTLLEYSLIVSLISVVTIGALDDLGLALSDVLTQVDDAIRSALGTGA